MPSPGRLARAVAAFALAALPVGAAAQPAAEPATQPAGPVRLTAGDFFRHPQFRDVRLSPDGRTLAATAPVNDRLALVAIPLADRKPVVLATLRDYDVSSFRWVNNERLVFSLGNVSEAASAGPRGGGGLFAINRDGSDLRTLAPTMKQAEARGDRVYRQVNYVGRTPELSDEVIAAANERSLQELDVYRVNTVTGRKTLLTFENPGRVSRWVIDPAGAVRAAISRDEANRTTTWWRPDGEAKWQALGTYELWDKDTLPLAFGPDGTFYVISNEGRDKYAIFTYDPVAKARRDLVFEHPDVDVGVNDRGRDPDPAKLLFDPVERRLAGVRYQAALPGVHWLDPAWEKSAADLRRAVDGLVPAFELPGASGRTVISAYADRNAGHWLLYDRKAGKLEPLLPRRPWLKESALVEMKPLRYRARDGLEIPAYVFLPKDTGGRKPPLVVNVHGGPTVRADVWGLEMWGPVESQFLAHHGYAVLLPNFRGTPGFGHRHVVAGLRQWHKAMQEDLEDGVAHLVREGLVDGDRVCLYGASYGGYATLMSLAKTPGRYRCGVAALVVSDLNLQLTSGKVDFAGNKAALHFWHRMVGDPATEADLLREASPVTHTARIRAPVFLISGEADRRTPLEQAEAMREALRKAGREPAWMVKAGEGHGFASTRNRVDMYEAMRRFLDRHIGPGARERPAREGDRATLTQPD